MADTRAICLGLIEEQFYATLNYLPDSDKENFPMTDKKPVIMLTESACEMHVSISCRIFNGDRNIITLPLLKSEPDRMYYFNRQEEIAQGLMVRLDRIDGLTGLDLINTYEFVLYKAKAFGWECIVPNVVEALTEAYNASNDVELNSGDFSIYKRAGELG